MTRTGAFPNLKWQPYFWTTLKGFVGVTLLSSKRDALCIWAQFAQCHLIFVFTPAPLYPTFWYYSRGLMSFVMG